MSSTEFPSNSKDSRPSEAPEEPKKDIQRVTRGVVVQRKKPLGRRFTETFFGGGDARTVWSYLAVDVMIPAARDMFFDVITRGAERMVYGESATGRRRGGGLPRHPNEPAYVAYNKFGPGPMVSAARVPESHDRHRVEMSRRARSAHDFREIILETRAEAEEVIERLFDCVQKYQTATVADLYDMLGIEPAFTDDKWGWYALPGANARRVRDGYLLDLPAPEPLD